MLFVTSISKRGNKREEVTNSFDFMSIIFPSCSNIQAAPIGISCGVKKLIQTKLPNMSQLSDISDYVLR